MRLPVASEKQKKRALPKDDGTSRSLNGSVQIIRPPAAPSCTARKTLSDFLLLHLRHNKHFDVRVLWLEVQLALIWGLPN